MVRVLCQRVMADVPGAPAFALPVLIYSGFVNCFASPHPMQLGQQNIGRPRALLLRCPSAEIETVKGMPTAWVISASGYAMRISFSMRLRLFITHPPVGQELMQIFLGDAAMTRAEGGIKNVRELSKSIKWIYRLDIQSDFVTR